MTKKIKLECTGDPDKEYPDKIVIGIDEAGKGPIAGPMYAGIVTFGLMADYEDDVIELGLKDSKQLSEKKREKIGTDIKSMVNIESATMLVVEMPADEIDKAVNMNDLFDKYVAKGLRNLLQRHTGLVGKKLESFIKHDCIVLMDGNRKIKGIPQDIQIARPKLDATSWAMAAASIIAKNAQVKYMRKLHKESPEYEFGSHKGYGTKAHFEAIKKNGFHDEHRKSWIKSEKIK